MNETPGRRSFCLFPSFHTFFIFMIFEYQFLQKISFFSACGLHSSRHYDNRWGDEGFRSTIVLHYPNPFFHAFCLCPCRFDLRLFSCPSCGRPFSCPCSPVLLLLFPTVFCLRALSSWRPYKSDLPNSAWRMLASELTRMQTNFIDLIHCYTERIHNRILIRRAKKNTCVFGWRYFERRIV